MQNAIVEKLRQHLQLGIDTECEVVYLLCEVRKLIDKYHAGSAPLALKFYCHWALHVDLTYPATTRSFMTQVDAYVGRILTGQVDIVEDHRLFEEFLMDNFRVELRNFLKAYGLPAALCDDEESWQEFLGQYSGVIQDGTLTCPAKNHAFNHVTEVVFTTTTTRSIAEQDLPFYPTWEIRLLDGRTLTVEIKKAAPIGERPSIVFRSRLT